ncbi:MAG: hypothetical protein JJ866_14895 [Roseibium sp.]|uniref:hypothetical protein n=1 Tax=Roseibium sp. TaxID=1936156 RepID=UPI001B0F797D|nr:hypothetical protein [Roseibium sp.]MBO6508828.1 hypothetical protein [Roseibium sp.]MBO6893228.1 hypothetical protein [Roseibium sp.]MBO6932125.1 hypothetical protein [Roseibium sp.]
MHFVKAALVGLCISLSPIPLTTGANAQGMPPEQIKQILDLTKTSWVSFRDWQGQQLIYFTHLESWKCGIDYVFYGLNGGPLDQMWELDECDPSNPNAVLKDKPYIELPAGSTQSISVQLIFPDGTKSAVETFNYQP